MTTPARFDRDALEFARAVTFFDAIFAFAVTLLITTVDDFSPDAWSSLDALLETNGPSLLAFAISFIVVVSFWRANHREVTSFAALDGRGILLNCAVMFGGVLIPFTTEALGKLDLPLPVAVYAVVISGTYLMQFIVVFDADRRGLRGTRMSPREKKWALLGAAILPVVFLGSIPVAYLVSPSWAQRCWIVPAVIYPVLGRLEQRSAPARTGDGTPATGNTPA
ncbi:TMEM175 family protein [Nakamurella sp. GG22]